MSRIQWLMITACLLFILQNSFAQTPDDVFTRGNELYRAGKYQEAIREYDRILKHGIASAEVYFNLGNAHYRNEQLAQAIL